MLASRTDGPNTQLRAQLEGAAVRVKSRGRLKISGHESDNRILRMRGRGQKAPRLVEKQGWERSAVIYLAELRLRFSV